MATKNQRTTVVGTPSVHRTQSRYGQNLWEKARCILAIVALSSAVATPRLWAGPERGPEETEMPPVKATVRAADGVVKYYAIIWGVADYPGTRNDLTYSAADASDVCEVLLTDSNWRRKNIWLLQNEQATRSAVYQAIQAIAARADADDICLFYFSGHGTTGTDTYPYDESDGRDEYLVPYDGLAHQSGSNTDVLVLSHCLRDDDLGTWLQSLPTSRYVVFLDTCHSGGHIKGLDDTKGIGDFTSDYDDGFAADLNRGVTTKDLDDYHCGVVVTACDDDETAVETSMFGSSLFTYFLVEGLSGAADFDWDGKVSAQECYVYVSMHMAIWGDDQHPQLYDSGDDFMDLLRASDCFTVTIAGGGYSWAFPMHTYYHDSRTQSTYLAEEVGQYGYITSLSLYIDGAPGQSLDNWTIRMKHADDNNGTLSSLDAYGWTVVYKGNEPAGGAGWRMFDLQTPLAYDGIANLLIDFSHDNTSYSGNGFCGCFSAETMRTVVARSDSQHGDPCHWPAPPSPSMQSSGNAPSVIVTIFRGN